MSWRPPWPRVPLPPQFGHAARVALAATLLVGVVYAGCVAILDRAVSARLVASVDTRLREHLAAPPRSGRPAAGHPAAGGEAGPDGGVHADQDGDVDEAPVFLWPARPGNAAVALTAGAPALPAGRIRAGSGPVTVRLGASTFRLDQARRDGSWLVAGQSLAEQQHTMNVLRGGEALVGPVLLLAMFAGSLVIGLRALSPVEQSRRRQLEFTADASHELRTPLSVISAEIGIALSAPRSAADYQAALLRIGDESQRLRRIVEDLLWLARFDSQPPPPGDEPLDLCTIAGQCADRFQAVAHSQSLGISVTASPAQAAWITRAPGMDRPARRGPGGQRLPLRRTRRDRPAGRVRPWQPGQPDGGRQRAGHPGRAAAPAVRPVPPRHRPGDCRAGRRGRAGAGHRRLDRAVNRGALADRRVAARRRAVRGVLAPARRAGAGRDAAARCARTRPGPARGAAADPGQLRRPVRWLARRPR